MADKGIIFSAPMARALLAGRKTQTRRLISPAPPSVEQIRRLSGSGYHWFPRKSGDREWSVAGPVWAVRKITGEQLPKIKVPYAPGDRLYVREAHYFNHYEYADQRAPKERPADLTDEYLCYRATEDDCEIQNKARWRPSIHMPRWASRMWLEVTEVRVQRLQEISEEDARAEGLGDHELYGFDARGWLRDLWDSLHPTKGERWEDNPWIVAVSFAVHRGNIDEVAG